MKANLRPVHKQPYMKVLEVITPQTLLLVIAVILSLGIALRIAGPITLTVPHVEIPAFTLHIGNAPAAPVVPKPKIATPHKHHNGKAAPKRGLGR